MREGVYFFPHTLSLLPKAQQDIVNNMLPGDTGFEIECRTNVESYIVKLRLIKLGAVESKCDFNEIRFRIQPGIQGLVVLHNCLEYLKTVCHPNPASGIHYHIDCRDLDWDKVSHDFNRGFRGQWDKYLLDPLVSWGYKGNYNDWRISENKEAVRLCYYYQTVEFRIGEHTLDYNLIVHRIVHCHKLVKNWKAYLKRAL